MATRNLDPLLKQPTVGALVGYIYYPLFKFSSSIYFDLAVSSVEERVHLVETLL